MNGYLSPPPGDTCGATIDGRKLLAVDGVFYLDRGPSCTLPPRHEGLHEDGEARWSEEYSR